MSRVSRTVLEKAWEHVILSEAKDLSLLLPNAPEMLRWRSA
jgi:hypothetical protein